ncbi:MAG: type II secretion system protein [Luteolibacter sp.]
MKTQIPVVLKSMRANKPAFTLVELLVVIAIIATLASIVFVVAGKMRTTAHRATSVSNLRNIGIGFASIMSDGPPGLGGGPGVFPSQKGTTDDGVSYYWPDLVGEALGLVVIKNNKFTWTSDPAKSIFQNPGRQLQEGVDPKFKSLDPENFENTSSYAYNYRLASFNTWKTSNTVGAHQTWFAKRGMNPGTRPRLIHVEDLGKLVLVCENNGDGVSEQIVHPLQKPSLPGDFYKGGCNAVFADGHVEWKTVSQFAEWQKAGGGRGAHSKYFDGTQGRSFGDAP